MFYLIIVFTAVACFVAGLIIIVREYRTSKVNVQAPLISDVIGDYDANVLDNAKELKKEAESSSIVKHMIDENLGANSKQKFLLLQNQTFACY
ncbi:MAG: hypothetical protein P9X22_01745 [Candidatus Zapsychrus exili]|nr:hypothetical protein [Candidatus Zapsychrus exili]